MAPEWCKNRFWWHFIFIFDLHQRALNWYNLNFCFWSAATSLKLVNFGRKCKNLWVGLKWNWMGLNWDVHWNDFRRKMSVTKSKEGLWSLTYILTIQPLFLGTNSPNWLIPIFTNSIHIKRMIVLNLGSPKRSSEVIWGGRMRSFCHWKSRWLNGIIKIWKIVI